MPYPPRAIVLTLDRLSRRCLSFYGHEWIEAPNLERLAACSAVFDQHFGTAADAIGQSDETSAFWARLREAGVEARHVAEEFAPSENDSTEGDTQDFEGDSFDLEKTPMARLMVEANQALTEFAARPDTSWLLWLKSAGITWPCVATEEFAELYADELEGDQVEFADEIRLAEVAYAACVTQLDHLVGRLLTTIEQLFREDPPLLILATLAGESLGESEPLPLEHVDTSPSPETWKLRDEMVHTPLLIRQSATGSVGSRRQELVQVSDLLPTLLDWFQADSRPFAAALDQQLNSRSLLPLVGNEEFSCREAVFLRDDEGHAAMRTRDFLLVEREAAELLGSVSSSERTDAVDFSCQLFLKPEDVWEVNDVAEQNPEKVAVMRDALREWLRRE